MSELSAYASNGGGQDGADWSSPANCADAPNGNVTTYIPDGENAGLFDMGFDLSALPAKAVIKGFSLRLWLGDGGAPASFTELMIQAGSNWSEHQLTPAAPEPTDGDGDIDAYDYGGAAELWGLTPTAAQLRSQCQVRIGALTGGLATLDAAQLTVYYEPFAVCADQGAAIIDGSPFGGN